VYVTHLTLLTKWFRLTIPGTPDAGCLFIDLIVYIRKSLEGALTTGGHINRAPDLCTVFRQRGVILRSVGELRLRGSNGSKCVGVTP